MQESQSTLDDELVSNPYIQELYPGITRGELRKEIRRQCDVINQDRDEEKDVMDFLAALQSEE